MSQLAQEEKDEFIRKRSYALSLFEEGTTTEEILKKIYMENLDSENEDHAELIAKRIIDTVNMLYSTYNSLLDTSGTINEKLMGALSELSAEQKAEVLLSASHVFENLESVINNDETDSTSDKDEFERIKENGADEKTINNLLERLVSAITDEKNKELLLKNHKEQSKEEILGIAKTESKNNRKTTIAIDSMIIYTMAVRGKIKKIPRDTSLFAITSGVCLDNALEDIAYFADTASVKDSDDAFLFWIIAALIVICVSVFTGFILTGGFTVAPATTDILIGLLCVAVYSGMLISIEYMHFFDCSNIFDFPEINFPELKNKISDKIEKSISSVKERENITEELDIDTIYAHDSFEDRIYKSLWDDTIIT